MLTYKEIEKEDLASLAAMYVETFNAPPWNDAWTPETAGTRLRQMAEAETFYGICAYEEDALSALKFTGNLSGGYAKETLRMFSS